MAECHYCRTHTEPGQDREAAREELLKLWDQWQAAAAQGRSSEAKELRAMYLALLDRADWDMQESSSAPRESFTDVRRELGDRITGCPMVELTSRFPDAHGHSYTFDGQGESEQYLRFVHAEPGWDEGIAP